MSEQKPRLPLHVSTSAVAITGEYAVLDIDYRVVKIFETEAEAETFVAEANGIDVETVRRQTAEGERMLAEYRQNLIRHSQARRKA